MRPPPPSRPLPPRRRPPPPFPNRWLPQTATLTLDIGGTAFGSPDPAPLTTVIDLTASGPIAGSDAFFGDFTIEVDVEGHLLFVAAAVPGVGGREMVVDGTFSADTFAGTYVITGLADGTFTCTRT